VTLGIEKTMNNKDLIFNATSQNDVIKVGMGRFEKMLLNFGCLLSNMKLEFFPCNISLLHLLPLQFFHYNLPNLNIQD